MQFTGIGERQARSRVPSNQAQRPSAAAQRKQGGGSPADGPRLHERLERLQLDAAVHSIRRVQRPA